MVPTTATDTCVAFIRGLITIILAQMLTLVYYAHINCQNEFR